ncbi:MAG: 3-hydroxyacyl-CoA dehydrogenase, partial [Betaproteobacteria bacterium]|nr:3-hydroxyacyl-CoA dehydrogenase [Betaproteobacteria bacterium]
MKFDANRPDLTVGVLGTGAMGRGIVQVAAAGGMQVLMMDTRAGAADEARDFIAKMLTRAVEKGSMSKEDAAAATARIKVSMSKEDAAAATARIKVVNTLAEFKPCHVVIEAVVENLDVKRQVFGELENIVAPDCILVSNTSSMSVTSIAAKLKTPQRFAGFHFFNPVPLMRLVEVISGLLTEEWVCEALVTIGKRMTREPVRCTDAPGFLVNQVGRGFSLEATHLVDEGISTFVDVDRVMRDVGGFRMGPFELMELTGLDVTQPASNLIYNQFFQEPRYRPSLIMQS